MIKAILITWILFQIIVIGLTQFRARNNWENRVCPDDIIGGVSDFNAGIAGMFFPLAAFIPDNKWEYDFDKYCKNLKK